MNMHADITLKFQQKYQEQDLRDIEFAVDDEIKVFEENDISAIAIVIISFITKRNSISFSYKSVGKIFVIWNKIINISDSIQYL